jgi:hypothetical protein
VHVGDGTDGYYRNMVSGAHCCYLCHVKDYPTEPGAAGFPGDYRTVLAI